MQGAFVYVILFAVILLLVYSLGTPKEDDVIEMSYSTFLKWVEADLKNNENLGASLEESQWTISNVLITEKTLVARTENSSIPLSEFGSRYDIITTIPSEEQFYLDVNQIYKNLLGREVSPAEYDFDIETKLPAGTPWYVTWLPTIVMIGLVILLYYFIMRQQTGSGKGMASFGKSRARLTDPKSNSVTFKDVAGADEEKEELREIVEFLKNPEQFIKVGARIPKGVLLVGPSGHGQDAACQSRFRRSRRPLLYHLRFGFCGDVRRRRREPRARSV